MGSEMCIRDSYDGLRRINAAGTALLIVEQQVDRVLQIAGTAVVLEHGSVAYDGPVDGALAAVERVLASRGERTTTGIRPDRIPGPTPTATTEEGPDGTEES